MTDLILKLQNGSKLYGLDHAESDDDYIGIFVESPDLIFMGGKKQTRSLRETPNGERNGPGDVDGQAYSVRHFFHLAMGGNPSIITLFFAPENSIVSSIELGQKILDAKELFISAELKAPFQGYLKAQLQRLKGEKKGHQPNRPELIEQFGYDTKYAMQVARLGFQGREILSTGKITLPMPSVQQNICRNIREGKYNYHSCLKLLEYLELSLIDAGKYTKLPLAPDKNAIAKLSREIHEEYWNVY